MTINKRSVFLAAFILTSLCLSGCVPPPPHSKTNVCKIFQQYPKWYWAAQDAQKKYHVPISVQMAVVHQESRFNGTAKPPRKKLLGFIPWSRPTSARGYTQAINRTWRTFQKETGTTAGRTSFTAAVHFIGWYATRAHRRAGISRANAYEVYLAYHEGIGGYMRKSYLRKPWLIKVSHKVQRFADLYHGQLLRCRGKLPKKHWWNSL